MGSTKDMPMETMQFLLDPPLMQTIQVNRISAEQVNAYLSDIENPHLPVKGMCN